MWLDCSPMIESSSYWSWVSPPVQDSLYIGVVAVNNMTDAFRRRIECVEHASHVPSFELILKFIQ